MNSQYYPQGRSPPPLQHPIPTHAHYQIPEPPDTPVTDQTTQGYMRFTSPPGQGNMSSGQGPIPMQMSGMGYGQPAPQLPPHQQQQQQQQPYGAYAPPPQSSFQSFAGPNGIPNLGQYDATAQIGMQLGKNAMAAGQDYVQKNVSRVWPGDLDNTLTTPFWISVWRAYCAYQFFKTPVHGL